MKEALTAALEALKQAKELALGMATAAANAGQTASPKWRRAEALEREKFRLHIESSIAQLRAAEAESGWRPIAEAPKDTAIMVYVNGFKIAHYNIRLGKWIGYGLETSDTILMSRDPPTHWQPLPAPPAKEGK